MFSHVCARNLTPVSEECARDLIERQQITLFNYAFNRETPLGWKYSPTYRSGKSVDPEAVKRRKAREHWDRAVRKGVKDKVSGETMFQFGKDFKRIKP